MSAYRRVLGWVGPPSYTFRLFAVVSVLLASIQALRGNYLSALVIALNGLTMAVVAVAHAVEDRP